MKISFKQQKTFQTCLMPFHLQNFSSLHINEPNNPIFCSRENQIFFQITANNDFHFTPVVDRLNQFAGFETGVQLQFVDVQRFVGTPGIKVRRLRVYAETVYAVAVMG
jgi:hypothetical protein